MALGKEMVRYVCTYYNLEYTHFPDDLFAILHTSLTLIFAEYLNLKNIISVLNHINLQYNFNRTYISKSISTYMCNQVLFKKQKDKQMNVSGQFRRAAGTNVFMYSYSYYLHWDIFFFVFRYIFTVSKMFQIKAVDLNEIYILCYVPIVCTMN